MSLVSQAFKEQSSTQQGQLKGSDVNIGLVLAPCIEADGIGDQCREDSIEVEEEENGPVMR